MAARRRVLPDFFPVDNKNPVQNIVKKGPRGLPLYIGVDPGINGGIAGVEGAFAWAVKMPPTERDILDTLTSRGGTAIFAVIERVSSSPQMGVTSAFTFGRGYGGLCMALTAARIPFSEVSPVKWQTAMGCRTKGDKNISKRKAQQIFPEMVITHATADALLIAEYCRRLSTAQVGNG